MLSQNRNRGLPGRLLVGLALACVMVGTAGAADAPAGGQAPRGKVIVPEGQQADYRLHRLVLDHDLVPGGKSLEALPAGGLHINLGTVDGKPVQTWSTGARWRCQRLPTQAADDLAVGQAITGTIWVQSLQDPYPESKGTYPWVPITLQVQVSGASLQGTFTTEDGTAGKVSGSVVDRSALEKEAPLIIQADYPCFRGRFGNGCSEDTGLELVEDFKRDARLLWESERAEMIPGSYSWIMGGVGNLVVAQGRVYLNYQRPNTDVVSEKEWDALTGPTRSGKPRNLNQKLEIFFPPTMHDRAEALLRRRAAVAADEVLLCLDARTGLTLWRYEIPLACLNPSVSGRAWSFAKNGPFTTPFVTDDGKLFCLGGGQILFALDAATGEELWTFEMPERAEGLAEMIDQRLEQKNATKIKYGGMTSVACADGVVAVTTAQGLMGLDAKTGELRWGPVGDKTMLTQGGRGLIHSPLVWEHGGKRYFQLTNALIEPATGKLLWTIPGRMYGEVAAQVLAGDILLLPHKQQGWSAWRITPEGTGLLWENADPLPSFGTATVYQDLVYTVTMAEGKVPALTCFDLVTGKQLTQVKLGRGYGDICLWMAADNRLYGNAQTGTWSRIGAGVDDFRILDRNLNSGDFNYNQANSSPPAMCGGRLYARTQTSIVCYDLRQR